MLYFRLPQMQILYQPTLSPRLFLCPCFTDAEFCSVSTPLPACIISTSGFREKKPCVRSCSTFQIISVLLFPDLPVLLRNLTQDMAEISCADNIIRNIMRDYRSGANDPTASAPFPMVIPGLITTFPPIQTSDPMLTGLGKFYISGPHSGIYGMTGSKNRNMRSQKNTVSKSHPVLVQNGQPGIGIKTAFRRKCGSHGQNKPVG